MYFQSVEWNGTEDEGAEDYAKLIDTVRELLNELTVAVAPPEVLVETSHRLAGAVELLRPWASDVESAPPAGRRGDLPGRGHPLVPPYVLDEAEDGHLSGRVIFDRAQIGAGGAAHGGAISWLFDEVLGICVSEVAPTARTASLKVDFRALTPIGTELTMTGQVVRTEGRKIWAVGSLMSGNHKLAEAEGLFVQVRVPVVLG